MTVSTLHILIFCCLLLANLIITVLYFFFWNVADMDRKLITTVVMFVCPVVGPLFLGLAYIWYRLFFSAPVDLEDVIFSKERVETHTHAEEDKERNVVPLEEAIAITNEKDLRTLMFNIVRGDVKKYLSTIALALDSEDSETAHYAASVLQDALNEFRVTVEKKRAVESKDNTEKILRAEDLFDYMAPVLEQRVFTELEQKAYVTIFEEVGNQLFELAPEHMKPERIETLSMRLMEEGFYDVCERWCERAMRVYPDTLASFHCQLKLYYTKGDKEKFFETVEALRQSPVVVDSETLEFLRVFH